MPTHCVEIYHITCQFYVDRLCLYYALLNLFTFHYYFEDEGTFEGFMTNIKEKVELIIYNKILEIIKSELTIGRNDKELNIYNNTEINNFIEVNNLRILKLKNLIVEEYEKDNELELLLNPENDWITEYMYELFY